MANTLLHHITIPITSRHASSTSIQSCTLSYIITWKMIPNMVMNFTPISLFTYQVHRASTLWGMDSLQLRREPAVHNARASRCSFKSTTTRYLFTSCVFTEACQVVSCKAMSLKLHSEEHFSHNKLSAVCYLYGCLYLSTQFWYSGFKYQFNTNSFVSWWETLGNN